MKISVKGTKVKVTEKNLIQMTIFKAFGWSDEYYGILVNGTIGKLIMIDI